MRIPSSMSLLAAVLTLPLSHAPTLAGQESDADKIVEEVKVLNDDSKPQLQAQASMRLEKRGAAAVPAILDFVKARGHKAVSLGGADILTRIKDERLAALAADLVQDKDFFWRPMAMQGLAFQSQKAHVALFRAGLKDRLWGVRSNAVAGLQNVDDRASLDDVKKLLADEIHDVRSQAAKTLYGWGDESGLPVLVESLRSTVRWFDIDYGQLAREDAWNFLKKVAADDFGFKPWEGPKARAAGLAKWDAWMASKDPGWKAKVPEPARAKPDDAKYVFGFELRSCRKGDFFFRIDAEDNLVLGFFNLERAKLSPEERKAFDAALETVRDVNPNFAYGRGGCDFEQYYLPAGEGKFAKLWIGAQGRPLELDGFIKLCHSLVKSKFGDAAAVDFKERTEPFRGPD